MNRGKNNKKAKILFFEIREESLLRFPLWLSKALKLLSDEIELTFLVTEEIGDHVKCVVEDSLGPVEFHKSSWRSSVAAFEKQLKEIKPTTVVIFAHRLPDMALIIAARKLDIPSVYYQHGLYIPFMARSVSLFLTNFSKAIRYAFYGMSIGYENGVGRLPSLLSYVESFVFGKNSLEKYLLIDKIVTNKCLVYGDYWKTYHIEHYGYSAENIMIVGAPDLDGVDLESLPNPIDKKTESKFCYIAQTLVEDGRLDRVKMQLFLKNLASGVKTGGGKLLIKLHPRSDLSLYNDLDCVYECCENFPISDVYIGHYSTILIRAVAYSEKFLIVNFEGHIIPEYILMLADKVIESDDASSLNKAIESLRVKKSDVSALTEKRKKIKSYFDVSVKSSFDRAAIEVYSPMEIK